MQLCIYDPQVKEDLMRRELSMGKFEWDHPMASANSQSASAQSALVESNVACASSAEEACAGAHAIAILTEWDEFKVRPIPSVETIKRLTKGTKRVRLSLAWGQNK
eukprot:1148991-Prorocentrum_minimum.AAC.6